MEIYLIRHTTPDIEKGICYGQTDLDVTDSFDKEYERLSAHLPEQFDAVFSSPLKRCSKLALKFSEEPGYDDRLRELHFGEWEMMNWNDIDEQALNQWMGDFVHALCPGGESFRILYDRAVDFWEELLLENTDEVVFIFSHAGVIRALLCHSFGLSLKKAFNIRLDYGGVTLLHVQSNHHQLYFLNR